MADEQELLEKLKNGVINYKVQEVAGWAQQVLDEGHDPLNAVMNGLSAGMEEVGRLFEDEEYYVPEVLMCADALYGGLDILKPHIPKQDDVVTSTIVIASVAGDVHDIGKNIVKMMFDIAGWNVHDLGRDVPLEKIVEEQRRTNAEIVALSAMMTTTMRSMEQAVEEIKAENPDVAVMVGGAPVTKETADMYGAEGYAESAANAVEEGIRLIALLREKHNLKK